jgi:hypothetical protein
MSNFSDFISGGGSASYPTIFLHNSQTWVPPQDGNIMIHVIGAGGSGAGNNAGIWQSGAAGGYCKKNSLAVTTSGSFTVVVGAGGASVINANSVGATGGTTSIAGTGLSVLTGFGGAGGASSTGASSGGVATGGDVNNTGGNGGYRIGGGGVGLAGTGIAGGTGSAWQDTFGANCDILGDFYSSSLGQISGGSGGKGIYISNGQSASVGQSEAGPLAGGGGMVSQSMYSSIAGHASIGGGGGWSYAPSPGIVHSGRGGEGCVVIQYIP